MTLDEVRARFNEAYRIIWWQRRFWAAVADRGQAGALAKIQECDRLLAVVTELKDELKRRMDTEEKQPRLLDAPRRASYE